MKKSDPISCAMYAKDKNLLDTAGWKWAQKIRTMDSSPLIRLARRICKASRNAIKYKFGVRIPRTFKEALELHAQNGNTLWKESMDTKIHQLLDFETFRILKRNQKAPEGYTQVPLSMTTTTSTRTNDSSPPNQPSKRRRIDNEDTPTLCTSFNHGATPIVHKFSSVSNLHKDQQPRLSKNLFCTFDQAYHQQLKASLEFIKGLINDTKTEERTMQELNGLAIAILDNEKLEGSCISKIEYINKERKACT